MTLSQRQVADLERQTLELSARNKSGVLNRITSVFRRFRFNISSLTVTETESPDFSTVTVLFDSDENGKHQLVNQLYKLPDVISIK